MNVENIKINYEYLLSLTSRISSKTSATSFVKSPLLDVIMNKIENLNGKILITEGEKFVPYLSKFIKNDSKNIYTITVFNQFEYEVISNIFQDYKNVEVIKTQIYDSEFITQRFDAILSSPNFGIRAYGYEKRDFICRESELIAAQNLLLHLNPMGKLLILLPAKVSFGSGKIKELRNFIQRSYGIEEISEFPEGMLSNTNIKTFLYTFSTQIINDISVKKYELTDDKSNLETKDETFVMLPELEDQGDWNIEKIFAAQDADWLKYQNSQNKKLFLKEIADVFRGKTITDKDPNGNIGVVNISNINEYDINYEELDHIKDDERKVSKYLLKEGDLLLPVRGTAIRSAVFHEQSYPCIASANLIVIRPNNNQLSSTYLKIFFDSNIGKKLLQSIQQGTTIISTSYKDVQELEIPYLPYEEQVSIANKYNDALGIYQKTIEDAQTKWNSIVNDLQKKLEE